MRLVIRHFFSTQTGSEEIPAVSGDIEEDRHSTVGHPILIAALGHASSWVEPRTTHRNQGINFFLLSIAFMFAAYVASMNNDENTLAGCIGLIGAVGSLLFWQQDLRLRAVLRAGVRPLRDVQKVFAEIPSLEIVRLTERPGRRQASTAVLVTATYLCGFTGSLAGAVYGFLR